MAEAQKAFWMKKKDDAYMTPEYAWKNIEPFIPRDKVIWEPFYGDGKSGEYLRNMGFQVIHENEDFFAHDRGDIIVSNPPFSKTKEVLNRVVELGKPFILILPTSKLTRQYFQKLFLEGDDRSKIQIIIPEKRIHFKNLNSSTNASNACFDCFYYCWKIGLENDITWLRDQKK